jgi:hypothetical protein
VPYRSIPWCCPSSMMSPFFNLTGSILICERSAYHCGKATRGHETAQDYSIIFVIATKLLFKQPPRKHLPVEVYHLAQPRQLSLDYHSRRHWCFPSNWLTSSTADVRFVVVKASLGLNLGEIHELKSFDVISVEETPSRLASGRPFMLMSVLI